ncbi:hypothetical protein [Actinomadura sp. HBU206391]|uniref:hypothetical protein n=1 Tax=Actinomadura sp. HBU206391 TaxID=2731692 RepID=UPI00164EF429|nr:hypothetical protein [Actinomadura sp. HBU206391]MBC6461583.1 hypothetical protein [Actinomadura sp. HBU206391]
MGHVRHQWPTTQLDYLLFSADRLAPHPGTLPKLSPDTAMPSLTEPSDHLPLRVDFVLSGFTVDQPGADEPVDQAAGARPGFTDQQLTQAGEGERLPVLQ